MNSRFFFGLVLVAFIFAISSCIRGTERIGEINDSIKLSTHRADLSASNDSIVITTKGTGWWVDDITVNGNYLVFNPVETEKSTFSIHGNWFSIERYDNQKFIVRVAENQSDQERNIKITLGAGDCHDCIDVIQPAQESINRDL